MVHSKDNCCDFERGERQKERGERRKREREREREREGERGWGEIEGIWRLGEYLCVCACVSAYEVERLRKRE